MHIIVKVNDQGAMLADKACQCDHCACPQAQCHSSGSLMIFTQAQDLALAQGNRFKQPHYVFLPHIIAPDIRPPILS